MLIISRTVRSVLFTVFFFFTSSMIIPKFGLISEYALAQTEAEIFDVSNAKNAMIIDSNNQYYMYYKYNQSTTECNFSSLGFAIYDDGDIWHENTNNPIFSGNCDYHYYSWTSDGGWFGNDYHNYVKKNTYTSLAFPFVINCENNSKYKIW